MFSVFSLWSIDDSNFYEEFQSYTELLLSQTAKFSYLWQTRWSDIFEATPTDVAVRGRNSTWDLEQL